MAFFVVYEEKSTRRGRAAIPAIYVANQAYTSMADAEAGQREIAERSKQLGNPEPDFRIIEATTVSAALEQAGAPIPPRTC
jgi:hypothetical protein